MILWIVELLFLLVVMRFIEEIGLEGCCAVCVILNVISAALAAITLSSLLWALVSGLITGVVIYFLAKLGLIVIRALGTFGFFIIGLIVVLALLAIIL